jgi:MFS family permease
MFPAMNSMIAHWSIPEERSRMSNLIFSGIPLGTAITMISGGYFIQIWGWPAIFYAAGICSFIWFIFWCFFVFDYPSTHPRISAAELQFIEYAMNGQTNKVKIAQN